MVSKDKEELIRKLLKEGKDWEHIRLEAHCSPNTIRKVKEKKEQNRASKVKSARSEALRMYNKGCAPLDVAYRLDISADEAIEYKSQFLKLKGREENEQFYEANKESIPMLKRIAQEMQIRNISPDQVLQAVYIVLELPRLRNEIQRLTMDCRERQEVFRRLQDEVLSKSMELHDLEIETRRIQEIKNENYEELSKSVSAIVRYTIGNKSILLITALQAILRAIREHPDHSAVLMNLSRTGLQNEFDQSLGQELVAGACIFYDDILRELVNRAITGIESMPPISAWL